MKFMSFIKKKYFLFIICFSVLASLLLLNGDLPMKMDGPLYIILAKSLAFNHSYNDICYPGEPPEGVEHPFLYPLLLSFVLMLFPKTVIGLKLVSAFFGITSLWVIYFFFSGKYVNFNLRHKKHKLQDIINCSSLFSRSVLILLFTCTNLWFMFFLVTTIPETTYLLFSMLAILFLKQYKKQNTRFNRYLVFGIMSLILAYFTKSMGIFLILASVIYFVVQKQYKKAMLITFFCSLLIFPWIMYKIIVIPSTLGKEGSFPQTYLFQIWQGHQGSLINLLKTIPWNIIQYGKAITHLLLPGYFLGIPCFEGKGFFCILYGFISGIKETNISSSLPFFSFLMIIFFSGLTLVGFLSRIRGKNLIEIYFFIYFLVLLLCPPNYYFVGGKRYLFPLLPFIFYYLWTAVFLLKKKLSLSKPLFKTIILIIFIIFFYGNIVPLLWGIKGNVDYLINKKRISLRERSYYYSSGCFVYGELALWVKENTFSDDVFMAYDAPAFYLFTDRKTCYFYWGRYQLDTEQRKIADIVSEIEKNNVKYIVVESVYPKSERMIEKLNYYCKEKIFVPIVRINLLQDEEIQLFKILRVNPKAKQLNNQGVYWYNKRDFIQAAKSFQKALEIENNFIEYFNSGCCYEKKGLLQEALDNYEKAIKLQPNYEIAKNKAEIIKTIEELRQTPNNALLWMGLGKAYMEDKNYNFATECFIKTIQINAHLAEAYYALGEAYMFYGDYDEVIKAFKKALEEEHSLSLNYKIKHYIKIMQSIKKEECNSFFGEIEEIKTLLK